MPFSEEIVKKAWERAKGKCECTRITHNNHSDRCCNKTLCFDNRGKDGERGAWEAHHKTAAVSDGKDTLSNCEILCMDCHKQTESYGRPKK